MMLVENLCKEPPLQLIENLCVIAPAYSWDYLDTLTISLTAGISVGIFYPTLTECSLIVSLPLLATSLVLVWPVAVGLTHIKLEPIDADNDPIFKTYINPTSKFLSSFFGGNDDTHEVLAPNNMGLCNVD